MQLTSDSVSTRLAVLRFPLMLGVVFIHAGFTQGITGAHLPVTTSIKSFISDGLTNPCVPLFFLLSGYFFFANFSWSFSNYAGKLKKRVKTLLIPFLFWTHLVVLIYLLFQNLPFTKQYFTNTRPAVATFGIYEYADSIIGFTEHFRTSLYAVQFWFLRDLIVLVLIAPVFYFFFHRQFCFGSERLTYYCRIVIAFIFIWIFLKYKSTPWGFAPWGINLPRADAFLFFAAGSGLALNNKTPFVLDRCGIANGILFLLIIAFLNFGNKLEIQDITFSQYCIIQGLSTITGSVFYLYLTRFLISENYEDNSKLDKLKTLFFRAAPFTFLLFAIHEPAQNFLGRVLYKQNQFSPYTETTALLIYFGLPALMLTFTITIYIILNRFSPRFLSLITGNRSFTWLFSSHIYQRLRRSAAE
jgi:surface polysaccharide O-acyltransferase-like enzyme